MAQSAYVLKDYPTAEREITRVLDVRTQEHSRALGDKREAAGETAFAALVLTRLNRQADAQQLIEPVLKFERELAARGQDDPSQRVELATALYIASTAGVGDATAQLAEAAALIDKVPPEMRRLKSVAIWRDRIAEERSRRRPV